MNLNSKIEAIKWILSKHGIASVYIYYFRKIFWRDQSNKSCRLFLFELNKPRPSTKSLDSSATHIFRFATEDELENLKNENKWDISERDINAFKNGDRCLLQLDGENLAGYSWIASSPLVEIKWGFHFNLPDDALYNYKGFTAPEYRGKGFQPLRHLKILEHAKSTGQYRLFGFVDHLNLNSLKGVRKSGYVKVGVLRGKISKNNIFFQLKVSNHIWSKRKRT